MFPKGTSGETTAHGTPTYTPAMDVAESESRYVVSLDLPGVKIEDIKIEIHEDRLTVSGTRSAIERNNGTQYHREERSFLANSVELSFFPRASTRKKSKPAITPVSWKS